MRSLILFFLCYLITPAALLAQERFIVRGGVTDSTAHVNLFHATVIVLNAKDSTLVKFTRAAADGSFIINDLRPGSFILLVSYPQYADYVEHFKLNENHLVQLTGVINMQLKERLLKEVLVKGTAVAIKIKGDTTEFN